VAENHSVLENANNDNALKDVFLQRLSSSDFLNGFSMLEANPVKVAIFVC
jgi:hypothetical protein